MHVSWLRVRPECINRRHAARPRVDKAATGTPCLLGRRLSRITRPPTRAIKMSDHVDFDDEIPQLCRFFGRHLDFKMNGAVAAKLRPLYRRKIAGYVRFNYHSSHLSPVLPRLQSSTLREDTMPPKVLVFGSGSIGGVYAYVISKAVSPSNIVCVCRSNYQAALNNGFTIKSTIFGNHNFRPKVVRSVSEAVALGPFHVSIVGS